MDSLANRADRLDEAAGTLTAAGYAVLAGPLDPAEFGAEAPGRLGELGRELHGRWMAALEARGREATSMAARFGAAATAVRTAAERYAGTDEVARRRHAQEG